VLRIGPTTAAFLTGNLKVGVRSGITNGAYDDFEANQAVAAGGDGTDFPWQSFLNQFPIQTPIAVVGY
jgi:hypothetical protein